MTKSTGRLAPNVLVDVVKGLSEGCRAVGCALLGGETAELPGVYREQELDFAGTCVGLVERDRLIDGSRCEPGDLVLGLPSSGLHTNGYSLVRELVGEEDFDADLLLAPHRLYLDEIRQLRAEECSVAEIARRTGATVSEVRRIVGKLDPADKERRRTGSGGTPRWRDERADPHGPPT